MQRGSANGVLNIGGGCDATWSNLSAGKEPTIFQAVRDGSILENVVYDETTRTVDYDSMSITENTRCRKQKSPAEARLWFEPRRITRRD